MATRAELREQLLLRQCRAPKPGTNAKEQCPLQASRLLKDKATGTLVAGLCTTHHAEWIAAGKTIPASWKSRDQVPGTLEPLAAAEEKP